MSASNILPTGEHPLNTFRDTMPGEFAYSGASRMAQQFIYWCHPWDLEDEGVEVAISRLAGDIGVETISVTATHPGIYQLRPRPLGDRWSFQCGAAAHFQPDPRHYEASRIRPHAAGWMKSRNPLERIVKVAERERIRLRARVSCLKGEELVARNPHAACVNVFGDPSRNWICPSHPDVREYVAGLVEDLWTNYGLDAIELEHLEQSFPHSAVMSGDASVKKACESILERCYCAACRQRAADEGVDVEPFRIAAIESWRQAMNSERVPIAGKQVEDFSACDAEAGFPSQSDAATSLIRNIRKKTRASLKGHVSVRCRSSTLIGWREAQECGAWIRESNETTDGLELSAANDVSQPSTCEVLIPFHAGAIPNGPALVSRVHQLSLAGYAGIGFDNYGITPEPCFDWVRQAIRYARRETAV